jgi:hypothetical protein
LARPRIWQPFVRIDWASGYEYADDGRIRDRHRNVLSERDRRVTLTIHGTARQQSVSKVDLLALEWFGVPGCLNCVVCSRPTYHRAVHADGDPLNWARSNVVYEADFVAALRHERKCLIWAMESNYVPARRARSNRGPTRHVGDGDSWGSTREYIPPLGVNKVLSRLCTNPVGKTYWPLMPARKPVSKTPVGRKTPRNCQHKNSYSSCSMQWTA